MELAELEKKLLEIELPKEFRLNTCTVIKDPEKFVEAHLSFLKSNSGKRGYLPYYERLLIFYKQLK